MDNTSQNESMETHPFLPSGQWEGFYTYNIGPDASKHKMNFEMNFRQKRISGAGSDNVGVFLWKGTYDLAKMNCLMGKFYLGRHVVIYNGYIDEQGIWGTWTIQPFLKGGFHIWPVGQQESARKEEEKPEVSEQPKEALKKFVLK